MRYFFMIWILFLTGCESIQPLQKAPVTSPSVASIEISTANLPLKIAELNLALAKESNLLWMVRDSSTDGALVSIEKLLFLAKQYEEFGDAAESERLALKVTQIINLSWEQDRLNRNVSPSYSASD